MSKRFLLCVAAFAVSALLNLGNPTTAFAQRGINAGYCPAGTCAKNGGPRAMNVKFCSKANCVRGGQRR